MKYLVIFLVLACSYTKAQSCPNARFYGAIPNDGLDDRGALQAGLSQGCLILEAGTYDVISPGAPLVVTFELFGTGPGTLILFTGSASNRDWRGLELQGGSWVHDLTVDAHLMTDVTQQSPVLHVFGPQVGVRVDHLTCLSSTRAGDCLQSVGYAPDKWVKGLVVSHVKMLDCRRSCIAIHSGLDGFELDHLTMMATDQEIDMEGSGDIKNGNIHDNVVTIHPGHQSSIAFSLYEASNLEVHHNTLIGKGMQLFGCSSCFLHDNRVTQTLDASGVGLIDIMKDSYGVRMQDEVYVREATASGGSVVRTTPRGSVTPGNIVVIDSTFVLSSGGSFVNAMGTVGLRVEHSYLTYSGSLTGVVGVSSTGSNSVRGDTYVSHVLFDIPSGTGVYTSSSYAGMAAVNVTDSQAPSVSIGFRCDSPFTGSQITGPVTYSNNVMPTPMCTMVIP